MLSNDTPKPAALWLYNYVRGIAPVIPPDQRSRVGDGNANRVGTVQADDWASQIGRPNLRTFTWRITGGNDAGIFAIDPSTGELTRRQAAAARRAHDLHAEGRASATASTRARETDVAVVTGDLANVVDRSAGGTVPATLVADARRARASARSRPAWPGSTTPTATATVTSTAGDAALSVADPATDRSGPAGERRVLARAAGPGRRHGRVRADRRTPQALHSYGGPVSNDALAIRFKQAIGASEPLRTGAYTKTFTFTLSTTTP